MKIKKKLLKQEVEKEFMYRAKYGKTQYTMEEVIYIVNKLIDDVIWEQNYEHNIKRIRRNKNGD